MLYEKLKFLQLQDALKVCTFGPTLGPIYPIKESEIERSKYFTGKNLSIRLSKYPKIKALSGLNFELKIQLLFAVFGVFSGKKVPKTQRSTGQRPG